MAALIRVDIRGHTTAGPPEMPPYPHTLTYTHLLVKRADGNCVDYATTAAGSVQVSTVRGPQWVGVGAKRGWGNEREGGGG